MNSAESSNVRGSQGQSQKANNISVEVILVHGTFARGAPWTDPYRSDLCDAIRKEVGGSVLFKQHLWTGANSFSARKRAALELAELLEKPRGSITHRFLIGHSHGGSIIAALAARRPDLIANCAGVIFLSTPFIQVQVSPHAQLVENLLLEVVRVLTWLIGGFSGLFFWLTLTADPEKSFVPIPGVLAVILSLSLFLSGKFLYDFLRGLSTAHALAEGYRRYIRYSYDYSDEALATSLYGAPKETPSKIAVRKVRNHFNLLGLHPEASLFVRMNGDEASAFLATSQFVSMVVNRILGTIVRLAQIVSPIFAMRWGGSLEKKGSTNLAGKLGRKFFIIFMIMAGIGYFASFAQNKVNLDNILVLQVFKWVFIISLYIVPMTVVLIVLVCLLVLPVAMVSFGGAIFLASLFVQFSVEPTPPGTWTMIQLDGKDESEQWATGTKVSLAHSKSYEDPRALLEIARWIERRLRLNSVVVCFTDGG